MLISFDGFDFKKNYFGTMDKVAQDVIRFWFEEIDQDLWFKKNEEFDQMIRSRFLDVFYLVKAGKTTHWRTTPEGRLAEILVLDQFSRNMFRGKPECFSGDELALKLAKEAVRVGDDQKLPIQMRSFMYMPYMHSEDPEAHDQAMKLFSQQGLEYNLEYEVLHKNIIDRFGRYPHRNQILGRTSTPEEIEFLKGPGSSF